MSIRTEQDWVLIEFVGGPLDGELDAAAPNDQVPFGYTMRTNPLHVSTELIWAADRAAAIEDFDGGTPGDYVRMIWEGEPLDPGLAQLALGPEHAASQIRRLERALLTGEEHESRIIASSFCLHVPSPTELIEAVLAPALRKVGERWQAGELTVYEERRASSIVESILGAHSGVSTSVAGHRVAVACLPDESHTLPARMAAVALHEDGWQVEALGGPVPVEELRTAAHERRLDLFVISTTLDTSLPAALAAKAQLEELGAAVLVGSPGRSLHELQRLARHVVLAQQR